MIGQGQKTNIPPLNGERLIVPVVFRTYHIGISINPSLGRGTGSAKRFANFLRQRVRKRHRGPKSMRKTVQYLMIWWWLFLLSLSLSLVLARKSSAWKSQLTEASRNGWLRRRKEKRIIIGNNWRRRKEGFVLLLVVVQDCCDFFL